MNYELVVEKNKYQEFKDFEKNKRGFVLFRLTDDKSKLFILAHGSKDGLIDLGGARLFNPKEVLQMLLDKKAIHENGIEKVYTLSCYGGYQTPATIEGVEIKSCHECKDLIYAKAFMTIDDECILDVVISIS